jgi:3-hydroxyisobutyrate dehydrogenase
MFPAAIDSVVSKSEGKAVSASLDEVAAGSDIIFSSLPRSSDVEAVCETLVASGKLHEGQVWIDTTSGVPDTSRRIAERLHGECGVHFLDCGVAGGPAGAEAGTLAAMVGGDEGVLERALPTMAHVMGKITHIGGSGSGHAVRLGFCLSCCCCSTTLHTLARSLFLFPILWVCEETHTPSTLHTTPLTRAIYIQVKSVNNTLLAANIWTAYEGLLVLARLGVPMEKALSAINSASGRSLVTEERIPNHVLSRKFDFGFALDLMRQDIGICMQAIDTLDMPAPVLKHINEMYKTAEQKYGAKAEHMEVLKLLEETAGAEIKASK